MSSLGRKAVTTNISTSNNSWWQGWCDDWVCGSSVGSVKHLGLKQSFIKYLWNSLQWQTPYRLCMERWSYCIFGTQPTAQWYLTNDCLSPRPFMNICSHTPNHPISPAIKNHWMRRESVFLLLSSLLKIPNSYLPLWLTLVWGPSPLSRPPVATLVM